MKNGLPLNLKISMLVRMIILFTCFLLPAEFIFGQATNYSPLFTSADFTRSIDLLRPVGVTAGASTVTPSGGSTYSIPIYAPPGTGGLQPVIALVYSSQMAGGAAGWGWNLTGLSTISRTGKNIFHNGIVKPVSNTSDDAFLLDGMRLNVITGNNGANGTVYAGESESFSQIISYTSGSPNNPDWFKVIAKDGTVMELGNSSDSRIMTDDGQNVILWRINKVIDINNNYVEFKYNNTDRDSRIEQILYTGNSATGLLPYNQLNFSYTVRNDPGTGYDGGASLSSLYLLDKISVVHTPDAGSAQTIKTYKLNYGFDNVHSMLKEIVEYGGDMSGPSLNSTIFLYGDPQQSMVVTPAASGGALQGANDLFTGDFDADGKTDILAATKYLNQGYTFHTGIQLMSDFSNGSPYVMYLQSLGPQEALYSNPHLVFKRQKNFLTSDFNKDGRDDVLKANAQTETVTGGAVYIKLNEIIINYTGSFNPGTGYTSYTPSSPFPFPDLGFRYSHNGKYIIPGDFDGDGNQDYILCLTQYPSYGGVPPSYGWNYKNFLTSPSSNEVNREIVEFGSATIDGNASDAYHMSKADYVLPIDFDGDGKNELFISSTNLSGVLSFDRISPASGYSFSEQVIYNTSEVKDGYKVFAGDFNGDRKTDLLVRNNTGSWKILYGTGKAFVSVPFTFNQSVNITGNYSDDLIVVADFNGDGKTDILHGFPVWVNGVSTSSKLSVYFSRGSGSSFYYEQYDYSRVLPSSPNGVADGITIGDFNGDGKSDIISKPSVLPGENIDLITFRPKSKELLLRKVTDGHNVTTEFDYKLLTDKTTYPYFYDRTVSLDDPSNSNPYNYVQIPLYAVSSLIVPDGSGGNNTTSYNYENAVIHRTGKGFLGFKKVTAKNDATGVTSITESDINTQFAVPYPVKQVTKLTATGELLSQSDITNTFVNLSTGFGDTRYFQKIDKVLTADYLKGNATEILNTYDSYGNITTNTTKIGILAGSTVAPTETNTTTKTYAIHNTPVPAKIDNETVTTGRAGSATKSVTTGYTYYPNGMMNTKTTFSGLPKAVSEYFTYDAFGNISLQTASTASAGTGRSWTYFFDSKGRMPTTKVTVSSTDATLETEVYSFDNKWGKILSYNTVGSPATTYEYDEFGRLKKTNYPQGYSVNTSLNWDVQTWSVYYAFTDYPALCKPDVKVWHDIFDRETKRQTKGFNDLWTTSLITYDTRGNLETRTNNAYDNEIALITTNYYDAYNRLITQEGSLGNTQYAYTTLGSGQYKITVTNPASQVSSQTLDATGNIISSTDNGGQLDFTYDSWRNKTQISQGGTVLVTSTFDDYGRQTSVTDKDAGTVNYTYNGLGQLTQQVDAKGTTYNMVYNELGKLLTKTGPEGITTYQYYTGLGNSYHNMLWKMTAPNGIVKEYTYDTYNRASTETMTVDGINYISTYEYDTFDHLIKTTYPSGIVMGRNYDINGHLIQKTYLPGDGHQNILLTVGGMNGFGQYTKFTLNNTKAVNTDYIYYFPTRIWGPKDRFNTQFLQDLRLTWNYASGNLTSRNDVLKGQTENFNYDNLNRITDNTIAGGSGNPQIALTYDNNGGVSLGNIKSKTDGGYYSYKSDKIHAIAYTRDIPEAGQSAVTPTPASVVSHTDQIITYSPSNKISSITEGTYQLDITYGPGDERVKTELRNNGVVAETKYFFNEYEKQIKNGVTREIHYVSSDRGICGILIKENGIITLYSVYTDHLGSLLTVTDKLTNIVAEQNFDAWGRYRTPANWNVFLSPNAAPSVPDWLYRGYTGHEMLPQFALVNMNGRFYDPVMGRMLSPDNYIPGTFNSQAYNRYNYASNNPLVITDPDGQFWHIIIGAVIGGVVNLGVKAFQGKIHSFSDGFKAFGVGAVAGAAGAATGGAALSMTGLSGASIVGGGLAGLTGSVVSSPILGFGNMAFFNDPYSAKNFGRDVLLGAAGGAIVGGTIAAVRGNNVWYGQPVENGKTIFSYQNYNKPSHGSISIGATKYGGVVDENGNYRDVFAGKKAGEVQFPMDGDLPEGKNIALGVRETLDKFAEKVSGETWKVWGNQDFQSQFSDVIKNPSNKIHFNLDGIGDKWAAYYDGMKGFPTGTYTGAQYITSWELYRVASDPNILARTIFYETQNGVFGPTSNPFH